MNTLCLALAARDGLAIAAGAPLTATGELHIASAAGRGAAVKLPIGSRLRRV